MLLCVSVCISMSCVVGAEEYSVGWLGQRQFLCVPVEGHLGVARLGNYEYRAPINTSLWVSVGTSGMYIPFLLGKEIPRSRIASLCWEYMFNFRRNCQTVFLSGHTILHSFPRYSFKSTMFETPSVSGLEGFP